ncbi:hypothetical protein FHT72_006326, partial [Rhizobium sp. BK077]|nr:hypothetical protein [Rhizobium sp. BK112]MBB3371794.1 hypothetical protein [Rhizobium sp. BK077]MBB4182761.1 hypothetical protein [Rhizobium sp. BK109]
MLAPIDASVVRSSRSLRIITWSSIEIATDLERQQVTADRFEGSAAGGGVQM